MALTTSFANKRVLVTGGGRGLGRGIVRRFYEDNALVFTLDRDQDLLDSLKNDFPNVTTRQVDVTDWNATKAAVESFLPIDILINNAGVLISEKFLDIVPESLNKVLDVNFKAYLNVAQVVAKRMIQDKIEGTIVNVASIASQVTCPGLLTYSASKAAVVMLTKSMANELGEYGIRANSISPTGVDTQMVAQLPPEAGPIVARAMFKRLLEVDEVVNTIMYLASPKSSMITGENINMDGGLSTC